MKYSNLLFLSMTVLVGFIFNSCSPEKDSYEVSIKHELVEDLTYSFEATSEGEIDKAVWTIDGQTVEGTKVEYTFEEDGTYEVKVKVTYADGNEKEAVKSVDVSMSYEVAKVSTRFGDMYLYLYRSTVEHRKNFVKLAGDGYFDGTTFHRVIKDFVIQGGDPNSKDEDYSDDGQGGPAYTLPAEISTNLKHTKGAVGAARKGDQVNPDRRSNGSQFYIVVNEQGTPHLDGGYTVFATTIDGIEHAFEIANVNKNSSDRPLERVEMTVTIETYSAAQLKDKFNFSIPAE